MNITLQKIFDIKYKLEKLSFIPTIDLLIEELLKEQKGMDRYEYLNEERIKMLSIVETAEAQNDTTWIEDLKLKLKEIDDEMTAINNSDIDFDDDSADEAANLN